MKAKRFETFGMMCPACPKVLERKLEKVPGVVCAECDLRRGTTSVIYDGELIDELSIAEAIYQSGFGVLVELREPRETV